MSRSNGNFPFLLSSILRCISANSEINYLSDNNIIGTIDLMFILKPIIHYEFTTVTLLVE